MASPQCCANPPAVNAAVGEGRVVDSFGGITAYVAGATESKAAVVLISDVFGFEAPNLRKIADKVASSGYFVVVPDFLHGDPYAPENADKPIQVWLKEHAPEKSCEEAKLVIAALKEQGVSSVGAAGYCWGAKVVVELAKAHEIQAAVLLHPSRVTVDDIREVKCPIAILGAEVDHVSPPELVKQFEQVLSSNSGTTFGARHRKNPLQQHHHLSHPRYHPGRKSPKEDHYPEHYLLPDNGPSSRARAEVSGRSVFVVVAARIRGVAARERERRRGARGRPDPGRGGGELGGGPAGCR